MALQNSSGKSELTRTASAKFQLLEQVSAAAQGNGALTLLDLHTALALTRWMDADLKVWRPQKMLADDLGLSLNGVRKSIDRLVADGHLEIISGGAGRGHSTVYRFILKEQEKGNDGCTFGAEKEQQPLHFSDDKRATAVTEKGNSRSHKRATAVAPTPYSKSVEESVEGSISLRSAHETTLQGEFQQLWKQYPRKAARTHAFKAFKAARKSADFATLMAGVVRYSAEREGQDPKFTKHLATWLNGGCWEDEPSQPFAAAAPGHRTDAKSRTGDKSRDLLRQAEEGEAPPLRIIGGSIQ